MDKHQEAELRSELKSLFRSKYNSEKWQRMLIDFFGAREIRAIPRELTSEHNDKVVGRELGKLSLPGFEIGLYEFEIKKSYRIAFNRVGLRSLVKSYTNYEVDAALVVYYSGNQWRLSYICDLRDEKTAPKRFTYLFGNPDETYRTPIDRFLLLQRSGVTRENIRAAFSVEALNIEFYRFIAGQFYQLVGAVLGEGKSKKVFERIMKLPGHRDDRTYQEFAVRLIGRTVFCWFLKEKKSKDGVPLLPVQLLSGKSPEVFGDYYHSVLERIFFQTLNTPMDERVEGLPEGCASIPFLNGGLFDYHTDDFYEPSANGESKFREELSIPDKWFTDLFCELEQYNFTIDENSPEDIEVSVDPEMLGRIFENLLAEIDPDSGESARKSSGSFYTPREIVDYMVSESLAYYLRDKTGIGWERIMPLFGGTRTEAEFTDKEREALLKAFDELKVLDPACGSGAFPMGVLMKMTGALQLLDGNAAWWKKRQIERIDNAKVRQELQEKLGTATVEYARKIGIIQNTLYGVDVQPIAAEISKLRCFLSLIVDENVSDTKPNRGVEPLPNLEFKFVTANSLMNLPETTDFGGLFGRDTTYELAEQLRQLRIDYMQSYGERKKQIKRDFLELQKQILAADADIDIRSREYLISRWNPFSQDRSGWFDAEWMFGVKDKFDIVIGNPPYISAPGQEKVPHLKEQRQQIKAAKRYDSLCQKWDLYIPFIELGLQSLKERGIVSMIVPYPVTNQTYAQKIRKMLVEGHNLLEVTDLNGTKVFENATVSNCILFAQRAPSQDCVAISHIGKSKNIFHAFRKTTDDLVQDKQTGVWNLTLEKRETARHDAMQVLGDYCYISKGMVLNADEKTAKGDFAKEELLSKTQDAVHCRQYIEAKDVEKYRVKRVRYLEWNTERCPAKLSRPTFPELYEPEKLVMNCLGRISATIDVGDKLLHNHSIYCAVRWCDLRGVSNKSITASVKRYSRLDRASMERLSEGIDLRFLLGILNSQYADVLLANQRAGDYHIYPEHMRNLPIPAATPEQQHTIADLVDRILEAKRENPGVDTSELEARIDRMVYELYGLTPGEIDVIEGRNLPTEQLNDSDRNK